MTDSASDSGKNNQKSIINMKVNLKVKLLPVYYGWAKINKIAKREALTVIFLNDTTGPRIGKDGYDGVSRFIEICHMRYQTEAELTDARFANRVYTVYSIFMDDKHINGSLEAALRINFDADKNHVSENERRKIMEKLKVHYMSKHPNYKEPLKGPVQLKFDFWNE